MLTKSMKIPLCYSPIHLPNESSRFFPFLLFFFPGRLRRHSVPSGSPWICPTTTPRFFSFECWPNFCRRRLLFFPCETWSMSSSKSKSNSVCFFCSNDLRFQLRFIRNLFSIIALMHAYSTLSFVLHMYRLVYYLASSKDKVPTVKIFLRSKISQFETLVKETKAGMMDAFRYAFVILSCSLVCNWNSLDQCLKLFFEVSEQLREREKHYLIVIVVLFAVYVQFLFVEIYLPL